MNDFLLIFFPQIVYIIGVRIHSLTLVVGTFQLRFIQCAITASYSDK